MDWEENIKDAIAVVEDELDAMPEYIAPSRRGISGEAGKKIGLELRKFILEDALLIGRHGLPKDGEKACIDPDCKLWPETHIAGDECHIFGVD